MFYKGMKFTGEYRRNLSKAAKKAWLNPKSVYNSQEYRLKMSKSTRGHKGCSHSVEFCRKIGDVHRGKTLSKEHRKKNIF